MANHSILRWYGRSCGGEYCDSCCLRIPHIRIVINVIALESLQAVCQTLKKMEIEPEIVCMQVSRAEKAGPYHLMKGENPVYILSFGGMEV